MAQAVSASKVKLHDLKTRFGLQQAQEETFFPEWVANLPALTEAEQQGLDRIKHNYLYLLEYPVMESIVKMVVLSPLLDLVGFYEPPFRVDGEVNIAVSAEDEGETIKGCIDVLAVQKRFWVTVIEAKNSEFSITKAIPQALAYMLASLQLDQPVLGFVLNGSEFLFLKLTMDKIPQYATSNLLSLLNRGNDLYIVLSVLKRFKNLINV